MSKSLRFPRINNVVISGRLTREPDLRYTASGTPIAKLSLAVDRRVQRDGNWENEVSYIDVITWDQKANACAEYLIKGNAVLVEGRLQTRSFTNNEGRNIKMTEIQASRVHFLEWNDNKPGPVEDDHFESGRDEKTPTPEINKKDETSSTEDDVPF